MNYEKACQSEASGYQISHKTGVLASNNLEKGLIPSELYVRKLAPFQIAGKLQYMPTHNGFKQVQIAYLAVISNIDKLVLPGYMLPLQIRALARPRAC